MPKISTRVVCVNGKQSCSISLDRSAEKTGLYLYIALYQDDGLKRLGFASFVQYTNRFLDIKRNDTVSSF